MSKAKQNNKKGSVRQPVGTPLSVSNPSANNSRSSAKGSSRKKSLLLPVTPIVFLLVWLWSAFVMDDVFRMVRENSFFAFDSTLMRYEMDKDYGMLWSIGRGLLMTFRYPMLGGLLLALLLTGSCWLLGYAMRLKPRFRWVEWVPLVVFPALFTYQGYSNWFEAESGQVMGIPFCIFLILLVWGIIIRSFSKKPTPAILLLPKDETPGQNRLQLLVAVVALALPMLFGAIWRPYVRPTAAQQVAVMNQDWQRVIDIAHANDEQSYRPMAAQYAIALVQTAQQGDKMFDIRLDYDTPFVCGMNGDTTNATNMYLMECDYHAGLVETAYHHAMESMAMEGPTIRNLKMLCKTSLMRNEWEVADKYLTILSRVPFEGDFVGKYRPMLRDTAAINNDAEMKMVRLVEPLHDAFENRYVQPVFLGYNALLFEGRSVNALYNSIMVNIYTKTMPGFLERAQPLQGTTPPTSISEALTLMSNKYPQLQQSFPGLSMYQSRLQSFVDDTRQFMATPEDRAKHARELFPKYKGYYPYYYFFGNLKATKKPADKKDSSNSGVN